MAQERTSTSSQLSQVTALDVARKILYQEAEAILTLKEELDSSFWTCAQLLSDCTGMIWVTGVGTSESVGMRFAHILTGCGARAMFLSPTQGLHGHTGVISPGDLLVAMSRGGESDEVIQMVSIVNQRQATSIAFVHNTDSRLAQVAQYVLPIRSKAEYELMSYLATTSTVAFSAMCDALCAVVQQAKGYTIQQLSQTHPGGAVGQSLEALHPADSTSKTGTETEGNA